MNVSKLAPSRGRISNGGVAKGGGGSYQKIVGGIIKTKKEGTRKGRGQKMGGTGKRLGKS